MPHDLFGNVVARPSSVRSRRSPLVLVLLSAHVAVVAGVVVTSIVAPNALPFPTKVMAWKTAVPVRLADIPLPKSPKPSVRPAAASPVAPRPESVAPLAHVVATEGITRESGATTGFSGGGGPIEPREFTSIPGLGLPAAEPEPVAPPPSNAPVRLHSGIRAPRKIVDVAPVYTELARQIRQEGIVILEATIDVRGVVQSATVLRSLPFLDQAAIDAVRQWRFEPALLNDQPIPVIMTVTVRFTLR